VTAAEPPSRRRGALPAISRPSLVVYTRDARVPFSADDPDMECGWRCIPIPPTDDDGWVIVDERSDRATGWTRRAEKTEMNQ
jgi:hypothetical protein